MEIRFLLYIKISRGGAGSEEEERSAECGVGSDLRDEREIGAIT